MDLNSSIPLFNQSLALFPYEGTLREPLANMYTDYIDFCLFAVRYFSHTPICESKMVASGKIFN